MRPGDSSLITVANHDVPRSVRTNTRYKPAKVLRVKRTNAGSIQKLGKSATCRKVKSRFDASWYLPEPLHP
jgi:hypothetical protein